MQYQIQNPEGFARMLKKIIETDRLPELVFLGDDSEGKEIFFHT